MVSAYAIHPEITATGDKIFRVGTLATVQGQVGAELAGNVLGAQKVAADKDLVRLRELLTKGGASQSQVDKAEADVGSLDAQTT